MVPNKDRYAEKTVSGTGIKKVTTKIKKALDDFFK
jgi:hypothetical protein